MLKEVKKLTKKKQNRALIVICIVLTIVIIGIAIFFAYIRNLNKQIDFSLIRKGVTSITKIFYFDFSDRKNRVGEAKELESEQIYSHKSEWVSFYDLPQHLIDAFVSVEDKRFYEHNGVDWLRTGKAVLNYIFNFNSKSFGGSTITQQLIKNLTGENQISPKRKIEEVFRAIDLENRLGKNEILELYLNVVYLSQNCYGVGSAAKLYFEKDVEDLSLLECASLSAIVQNPSKYDPYKHPENNLNRAHLVLSLMLEQGKITDEEYKNSLNEDLDVSEEIANDSNKRIYSWYTEKLIDDVSRDLSTEYQITKKEARDLIFKGGLNIYSLIDPEIQAKAEDVFEKYMIYISHMNGKYPQSACVVIDPKTSDVLAIIGGTGKKEANLVFNRATDAKRPPGSVLKPLSVYGPLINENIATYSTVYDDTPILLSDGSYWPKNSPNKYRGLVPLYYALEHSINTVAVKGVHDLSLNKSMLYLDKFGINYDKSLDYNDSSLALGQLTNGESLLNLTNAYSSFINDGFLSSPKTYLYVTDNLGNVILENNDYGARVILSDSAKIMTKMMENVTINGTAKGMDVLDKTSVAGKTGTSSNNEDKWFIGYTNDYVCGIWTGFDTPAPMYYSQNPSVKLFDALLTKIYANSSSKQTFNYNNLVERDFCFDSGMLPCESCNFDLRGNRIVKGYYRKGTEPGSKCHLHKKVIIDSETGKISNKILPFWRKKTIALLDYSRSLLPYAISDQDYLISNRKNDE